MPYRKYRNQRTNGFASKKEARRFQELTLLGKAGKITELATQHKFGLVVNEMHICDYVADFFYWDIDRGYYVIEDVKGFKTPIYRLKKKLMKAVLGLEITET